MPELGRPGGFDFAGFSVTYGAAGAPDAMSQQRLHPSVTHGPWSTELEAPSTLHLAAVMASTLHQGASPSAPLCWSAASNRYGKGAGSPSGRAGCATRNGASASAVITQGETVVWKFLARNGPSG